MARTPSNMLELATIAPDFALPDTVSGEIVTLAQVKKEKGVLVMFICNHCPYVIHVKDEIVKLANEYQAQGIGFVAISANDIVNYPDDAPDKMKDFAVQNSFTFPYLYDESQEIAKAYDAACTPDFYLFDRHLELVYRGRLDESRPNSGIPVTGKDLRIALEALMQGTAIPEEQYPSIGCNIKWK